MFTYQVSIVFPLEKPGPCFLLDTPQQILRIFFVFFLNFNSVFLHFIVVFFFIFLLTSVVHQFYQTRVIDEFVLRGNSATLKCLVPSFVADFIMIESWLDEEGKEIFRSQTNEEMGKHQRLIVKYFVYLHCLHYLHCVGIFC